ncbi:hypothetical protein SAMN04489724_3253 [Algoriphagus locisalis]|uniref:Uncharacterized protein n=1 Tax=Algoriphagus locisalis TaxID=305507 RepID=A0A1I7CJ63_9BACT|nr:hypothetical protein [Algoriphagus locisalis]SFT99467.1 hypothetical protein SAMN04489724_3253 [Algoriphagus locisalis]
MKSYNPKADLWSKIEQRKDFDLQVKEHVPNLPVKMPKADLWDSIESELDQKTPVIPLWKYVMVAASIALILAVTGIAYLEFGENTVVTPLTTDITVKAPEMNAPAKSEPAEIKPKAEIPTQNEAKESITNIPEQKETNRISPVSIEISTLDLPEIDIESSLISEVIIPPAPEKGELQTLHRVRISWGMQEKSKLQTRFGSSPSEDISGQQLGLVNQPKNSIKINFQKQ